MRYDLHSHSLFSDGRDSVWDMLKAAEAAGLDTFAVTDHVEADRWGNPIADWIEALLREAEAIRGKTKVRLLVGIEASLLDLKGHATVNPKLYSMVDLVLCGVEWGTLGIAQNPPENKVALQRNLVTAYGNLALNPWVDIISHPFNLGRFPTPLRLSELATSAIREIAAAFREGNKAFELNNTLWWWFPNQSPEEVLRECVRIVEEFAIAGVKFVWGSDAHSLHGVGNLRWAERLAQTVGLSPSHFLTPEQLRQHRLRKLL
ncbi:MAG: PHP domain-containing protein [Armatimonadota bacterium]